uniref:Uncharacterized protein n=1 Tax=Anopheles maculatus TaxID=74869 RepID=A0A182TAT8_9DIPT
MLKARERVTGSAFFKQLFNLSCIRLPTNVSSSVVGVLVTIYCLLAIALSLTIFYAQDAIYEMESWAWILFGVLLGLTLLVLLLIAIQPRERADAPFRVPLVPLLPGIMETSSEMGYRRNDEDDDAVLENGSVVSRSNHAAREHPNFPQQNGYYSQNLSTAISVETADKDARLIELKPNAPGKELAVVSALVVAGAGSEPEEEQRQTKQSRSNTSTPKSSFDEIIPLSEGTVRGFTEKVEPNGKVYFVAQEEDTTERDARKITPPRNGEHTEPGSLTDEKETSKAIAFLDHILDDEDTLPSGEETLSSAEYIGRTKGDDDESLASPVFREQSVIADIHRADDSIVEVEPKSYENDTEEPTREEQQKSTSNGDQQVQEETVDQEVNAEPHEKAQLPTITIASEDLPADSENDKPKLKPRVMYIAGMEGEGEPAPKLLTEEEQDQINFRAAEKERFMSRLSTLLVNPVKIPLKRLHPPDEEPMEGDHGVSAMSGRQLPILSPPSGPGIIRSTSEPSFVLFLNKLSHSNSPQESETDEPDPDRARSEHSSVVIPPAPKFDETLFNTIRAGSVIPDTPRSPIPMAPKFDPVLFNTLGKGKSQRASILPTTEPEPPTPLLTPVTPSEGQYYELELKKLKPVPSSTVVLPTALKPTSPGIETPRNETNKLDPDTEPSNPRAAFKSRLEKILQRGPLDVMGRPKSLQSVPVAAVSEENLQRTIADQQQPASSTDSGLSMASSNNSIVSTAPASTKQRDESFRDRARGFDTAKKKQKLLFDDVLKSINPETRPSSIRNSVEHRVSFRNFKDGLRKTAPPKQFLPDA